jgi:uncharacterized membrane protein
MKKLGMEFYIEWISTAVLIMGVALTAWNVYPLNVYFSMAGNFGWTIIGIMWRKWSLITIQAVVTVIYIAGILTNT